MIIYEDCEGKYLQAFHVAHRVSKLRPSEVACRNNNPLSQPAVPVQFHIFRQRLRHLKCHRMPNSGCTFTHKGNYPSTGIAIVRHLFQFMLLTLAKANTPEALREFSSHWWRPFLVQLYSIHQQHLEQEDVIWFAHYLVANVGAVHDGKKFLLVGMSMLILPVELANFFGFSSIIFRPHPKHEHRSKAPLHFGG